MITATKGRHLGCIPTYTFRGPAYRAQLKVFAWAETPWPDRPTEFGVNVLHNSYNPYTAYSAAGAQVYFGASLAAALGAIYKWVGPARVPDELKPYLEPEDEP